MRVDRFVETSKPPKRERGRRRAKRGLLFVIKTEFTLFVGGQSTIIARDCWEERGSIGRAVEWSNVDEPSIFDRSR